MSDKNVAKHSLRLNLRNEQHLRVQKVLSELNKDIYKSENQFIINALDFYIQSFESDEIIRPAQKKVQTEVVNKDDLESFKAEVVREVKDEFIRLLGSVIIGGQIAQASASRATGMQKVEEEAEESNPVITNLANQWG